MSKIVTRLKARTAPPPKKRGVDAPRATAAPAKRFHLDKRAAHLLGIEAANDDDDLLTTNEMAAWLQISVQWLSIARHRGDGPPFMRCGTRIRYKRGDVRRWLKLRTARWTGEYTSRGAAS